MLTTPTLHKPFYSEFLHILGLTEVSGSNRKYIERCAEGDRHPGSLLENTIQTLQDSDILAKLPRAHHYGCSATEQLFNVALELVITWVNRILFVKLLEAQLISYDPNNPEHSFLNSRRIPTWDAMQNLLFSPLSRLHGEQDNNAHEQFAGVPYFRTKLFEVSELERRTIEVGALSSDRTLPLLRGTALKGIPKNRMIEGLSYLLEFLAAFDFASTGASQEENRDRPVITASVLGLIFEKINGYKDGAFFTPSYVTMHMCREVIRKALLARFNQKKGWECRDFTELSNRILDKREANDIVNSLTICDPAVGSGHFLVAALHEIIACKHELNVLLDAEGAPLRGYDISVMNDEIMVTAEDGRAFRYVPGVHETQRVQEILFTEKRSIIENCLFGVDINPISASICRLRLWIELLKSSFYRPDGTLETLPSLDTNIQCGNSLVRRFGLDAEIPSIPNPHLGTVLRENATGEDDERASLFDNAIEWRFQFPKALDRSGRFEGFDVVIGNPPFGIPRGGAISKLEVAEWRATFGDLVTGKVNRCAAFLALGQELLRPGGICAFVTPNAWLGIRDGRALREHFLTKLRVLTLRYFTYPVFEDANVEVVIFTIQRATPNKEFTVYRHMTSDLRLGTANYVQTEDCLSSASKMIPLNWEDGVRGVIHALRERSITMRDEAAPFIPMIAMQPYAEGAGVPPQSKDDCKNRVYHRSDRQSADDIPFLEGRDVSRFRVAWSGEYLRYGAWLAEPQQLERYTQPRVVVREILQPLPLRVCAGYLEQPMMYTKSVLHILSKTQDPRMLKALAVLLNSKVGSFVVHYSGRKADRKVFPKLLLEDLRDFPLPRDLEALSEELAELHDTISSATSPACCNTAQERMDRRVFECYRLTEADVGFIEEKVGR